MKYLAACLGLALLAGATTPTLADDKWDRLPWSDTQPLTLRAGYNTVMQYPHARAIERFAQSGGRADGEDLRIQTFPSETLGSERQMLEGVIAGNIDIARFRPAW